MSPPKTPQPSVNRGEKTFLSFISRTNGWIEGWKSCDPWPSLSPSALQPPTQKSQQQPLATLAQGHRDKVRGRGGREPGSVWVCCKEKACAMRRCVRGSMFVLRHKGFKIRYTGVCVCVCMPRCVHVQSTGGHVITSTIPVAWCVCVCVE